MSQSDRFGGADLLPREATAYEKAQANVSARLLKAPTGVIRRERDPAKCDAAFVPYLGWERSVHHWTGIETIDRASIASSFSDHLSYGTPAALEKEISLDLGVPVEVQDFFQAGLTWPEFLVIVPVIDDQTTVPGADAIWQSAVQRKNVRDYPVLEYLARESGPLAVGAYLSVGMSAYILPYDATDRFTAPEMIGAMLSVIATYSVGPFK